MPKLRTLASKIFMMVSVFALLFSSQAASALSPEQKKLFQEGIYYYDATTCDTSGSSGGVSTTGETTGPTKAVQQVVWDTLTAGGIDPMHAAAVMGNIAHEGVWDPRNIEDVTGLKDSNDPAAAGSYGYGLIGWTPGTRLLDSMKEAGISGKPYTAETQAAVILAHIQGKTPSQYAPDIGRYFLATTNIEDATTAYQGTDARKGFENPTDKVGSLPDRKLSAKQFLQEFGGGTGTPTATSGPSSGGTCSCPSATGDGSSAATDGTNSAGNEYAFLVGKGVSPIAAAAITGNNIWESGGSVTELTLVPTQVNSIGATGIAQWYSGRATALHAYAQQHNKPWDDLGLQLDYLWHELTTTEQTALRATEAQKDIASATTTFERIFEVSGDTSSYPIRITAAKAVLQKFGGGAAGGAASPGGCASAQGDVSGYKNPFRDVDKLRPERIDMGVDYAGEGPVYALGSGTVKNLTNSGWNYGGYDAFISIELSDGPAKGKYSYMAEACIPVSGLHIGQQVTPDTVICHMINPTSTGIETGWAQPPGLGDTIASHNGGYTEGYATAAGENYNQLLVKLGVPSGVQQSKMGSLPADWPTW